MAKQNPFGGGGRKGGGDPWSGFFGGGKKGGKGGGKGKKGGGGKKQVTPFNPSDYLKQPSSLLPPLGKRGVKKEIKAATKLQFGPEQRQLQAQRRASRVSTQNIKDWFPQYKAAIAQTATDTGATYTQAQNAIQSSTDASSAYAEALRQRLNAESQASATARGASPSQAPSFAEGASQLARRTSADTLKGVIGGQGASQAAYLADKGRIASGEEAHQLLLEQARKRSYDADLQDLARRKGAFATDTRQKLQQAERDWYTALESAQNVKRGQKISAQTSKSNAALSAKTSRANAQLSAATQRRSQNISKHQQKRNRQRGSGPGTNKPTTSGSGGGGKGGGKNRPGASKNFQQNRSNIRGDIQATIGSVLNGRERRALAKGPSDPLYHKVFNAIVDHVASSGSSSNSSQVRAILNAYINQRYGNAPYRGPH